MHFSFKYIYTLPSTMNEGDILVFCPFSIDKDRLFPFILSGHITLACQKQNECIISSTTKIFKIQGAKAQVTISGFSFHQSGISNRATIHIKSIQSVSTQSLCFCHFERYVIDFLLLIVPTKE